MDIFSAITRKVERLEGDYLYVEYEPENIELREKVMHGVTLPILSSIAATVAAYEPVATGEMFLRVDALFPGSYAIETP